VLEVALYLLTVAFLGVLISPLIRRFRSPLWFQRLRERKRPGVPVLICLAGAGLMALAWMLGERRGLLGILLMLIWYGTPLVVLHILAAWRRQPG
jgi:hypothetical protein